MPETVTIGGKQYPKTLVYGAGAVTVGIVGYAWYTKGVRGGILEEELEEGILTELPEERIPATTIPVPAEFGVPPMTNADWSAKAIEMMINLGIDGPAALSAIGKFLQRQPLTAAEADLVRQAIAAAGPPPEFGPWVVIPLPTGAAVGLGKPTNFRATVRSNKSVTFNWDAVTGASGYEIGGPAGTARVTGTSYTRSHPLPNGTYTYTVKAFNTANNYSESASVTFVVGGASGGGGTRPPVPTGLAQTGVSHTGFSAQWKPISGVTSYKWSVSGGAPPSYVLKSGTVSGNKLTVRNLRRNAPYALYVWGVNGAGAGAKAYLRVHTQR